jgi:hypothetical protein
MIAIGGYLIVLAAWQLSGQAVVAGLSLAVVLLAIAPSFKCVATWLFGEKGKSDLSVVGQHLYWFSDDWSHPLIVEGIFVLAVVILGHAYLALLSRLWRWLRKCWRRLADPPPKSAPPQDGSSSVTPASAEDNEASGQSRRR